MSSVEAALAAHRDGRLDEAASLYQEVLERDAGSIAGLRGLGTLALQQGSLDEGIKLLRQCLAVSPQDTAARLNLGIALRRRSLEAEALDCFESVLRDRPDHAEAWFNRGISLKRLGRLADARSSYEACLRIKPDHASAWLNVGNLLLELAEPRQALTAFQCATQYASARAAGLDGLGRCHLSMDDAASALTFFEQACSETPQSATFHLNRASALQRMKRYDEAAQASSRCIAINPALSSGYLNLGNAERARGNQDKAIEAYQRAVAFNPSCADVHELLAYCHLQRKNFGLARDLYSRAVQLRPDGADGWAHLGLAHAGMGAFKAAEAAFKQALELDPKCEVALIGLPAALRDQHLWVAACEAYQTARQRLPASAEARYNQALLELAQGNFSDGWRGYEARWQLASHRKAWRGDHLKSWRGVEPLHEKTILVETEQGLGDTIHFMRFVPDLAARAGQVLLALPAALCALHWAHLPSNVQIVATGRTLPSAEFWCPLMSLPLALDLAGPIARQPPYVLADPQRVSYWQRSLKPALRRRIGVVARGNPEHVNDVHRSIELHHLLRAIPEEDQVILLQQTLKADDQRACERVRPYQFVGDQLQCFADTAALASCVDLVISVDTSVAHLSGAIGIPTWILLAYNSDWRWLIQRDDSPWYASVKLFRQQSHGDWESVLTNVRRALLST